MREYVWMVSADGVPWRIAADEDLNCSSQIEWESIECPNNSIRTIVSSSTTAFSIDKYGRVQMLVLPSHVALREKVEIFVNQRWYPILGWQRPLPTDRSRYSDETGRYWRDPSSSNVASGWSWEEPWTTHIDPRNFDKEGWQYSFSFMGAKWDKTCKRQHFVRRKMLKRHKRYTCHDKWVELSSSDSIMFVELAIGGTEIMKAGEILLFALGIDGYIYLRDRISSNLPNGIDWVRLPKIVLKDCVDVDDVTLITASSTLGTLVCITWDGRMFHRKGISRNEPCGMTWHQLATPKNKAVISAAIGKNSMWCITADGNIWFTSLEINKNRQEHVMENIRSDSYKLIADSGVCRLTITKNDHVICVSTENERLLVRTGTSNDEPGGKRFSNIIDRGDPLNQRYIAIHGGECSFEEIPEHFLNDNALRTKMECSEFKKSDWRLKIVERLQLRNDSSWKVMNNVRTDGINNEEDWEEGDEKQEIRKIRCQLLVGETFRSVSVKLTNLFLEITGEDGTQIVIDTVDILGVFPVFQRHPQKYILKMKLKKTDASRNFGFVDETAENTFRSLIENAIREQLCTKTRNASGEAMWSISDAGYPRWHCLSEMNNQFESMVPLVESKSLLVDGHFETIDCGAQRIVWAINSLGKMYTLNTKFDPLSVQEYEFEYKMTDEKTFEMYEYQKYAIFRGFITFQGSQKGISAWMCEDQPVQKHSPSLPSKSWTWIDSEWRLKNAEDKWEYANDMIGPFVESDEEKWKVRRRMWKRKAKYDSNRSPWCFVDGPDVQVVRVSKKENIKNNVVVVVLTVDGHILVRRGVNRENCAGTEWTQIVCDYPISCIHLQSNEKLWCISEDALIMSISFSTNDSSTPEWEHVDVNLTTLTKFFNKNSRKIVDVAGSQNILHIRIHNCLYRVDTVKNTVSDPYPMDNLRQAVTDSKGSVVLRGLNITVVKEWLVSPYENEKRTVIVARKIERATNMGNDMKCISMY